MKSGENNKEISNYIFKDSYAPKEAGLVIDRDINDARHILLKSIKTFKFYGRFLGFNDDTVTVFSSRCLSWSFISLR